MDGMNVAHNKLEILHSKRKKNLLSRLLFCWTFPVLLKGLKKDLNLEDLHSNVKKYDSSLLGDTLEREWESRKEYTDLTLAKSIIKLFGLRILKYGVILLVAEFIKVIQPFCLGKILEFYIVDGPVVTKKQACIYGFIIVAASFINVILMQHYMFSTLILGMNIRVACCSLIYRKTLKLNKTSGATIGHVMNLLSNDVNRFDKAVTYIHYLWIPPLQLIFVTYFLYNLFGFLSITGVLMIILFIPLQIYLGKMSSRYRFRIAQKTDRRVILMNEIISGIRLIKMYTWELPFAKLIEKARKCELKDIRSTSYIRAIHMSLSMFTNKTSLLMCILVYVLMGNKAEGYFIFLVTSFYNTLKDSMTFQFPRAIALISETHVSLKRINNFLCIDQVNNNVRLTVNKSDDTSSIISITNGYTGLLNILNEYKLTEINFMARKKEITAIVGPVGSGKTTLLSVLLKELPLEKGCLRISGTISYASQDPWLFSNSIKQNILFGSKFDADRYNEVCRVCALNDDFILLPYGDGTMLGENGATLSGGQQARINLARAVYRKADVYLLDNPLSAVDGKVGNEIFEKCFKKYLKDTCIVLVTNDLKYLSNCDKIYLLNSGEVQVSGTYDELKKTDGYFAKFRQEQITGGLKSKDVTKNMDESPNKEPPIFLETKNTGNVEFRDYLKYFAFGKSSVWAVFVFALFAGSQFLMSTADYSTSLWVRLNEYNCEINISPKECFIKDHFLHIFIIIIVLMVTFTLARSILFMLFCIRVSKNLHSTMVNNLLKTKIKFFDHNPTGRILNRFTKDLGAVDETLPQVLINSLQVGLNVVGVVLVVAIANYWLVIPTVIIFCVFYVFRYIYLSSSRDIKRIEGTTKSLVFHHIITSLQGLSTIRAFKVQNVLTREFDNQQNMHSSAYYNFLSCNATFGFWLDLLSVGYVAVVTFSFLLFDEVIFSGNVGLAITQALSLTGIFQWGMKQWAEVENQMISFERTIEYTNLESEESEVYIDPPESWPPYGQISFKNVNLKYNENEPCVLKNINVDIKANEKIGIVGRTGSGKSSLISTLLKLTDFNGQILIDSVNISSVSTNTLRSRISVIPQGPVLFAGTIRQNLDPHGQLNEIDLNRALQDVGLKNNSDYSIDLNYLVNEGGVNFSVGQRQLICLARAIVRKNKILILDEATANIDPVTDRIIQTVIREKFKDCTTITIAHKLNTIMDSDKVLVLDSGSVVEFDKPSLLLDSKKQFYQMICHADSY